MNMANDKIIELLKSEPNEIYLVGGVVRDVFLNHKNYDKDIIVCDEDAKTFATRFAQKHGGTCVTLDEVNNIYRVCMSDKVNYVDITNPINNSLEEDIKRRDLTINAVAMNIKTEEIIDLVGGLDDIKNGVIRAVSEENFIDDPLRILRAFRFASVLGFKIEKETKNIIEKHKSLILNPAVERRNVEILKLFGGKFAHEVILDMDNFGLIEKLFTSMIDVKKVPPNTHHHLDLFHHLVETVKQIQNIYKNSSNEVKEHLEKVDFGGDTRLAHLKFAGFIHDIGKFSTWTIEEDGRHRFIGHDEVGAKMAKTLLKQNKFSKKQIEYISFIIRHHIYPSSVVSAPEVNDKIYMRYVRKTEDNAIDLITVAKADRLSAQGVAVTKEMTENNINGLNALQDFYIKIKPTLKPIPKLIDGGEVMTLLNLKPSKELGLLMKSLHQAQLDGIVNTKTEAIDFLKNEYSKNQ
ncbi:CCA tRNA nucleotidyltransferase [bacterium]|nr:CCA tRNA nucleotidyltransferase [bacterium]